MTKLFVRAVLTSATAALLLAGCTAKEPGNASPASTSSAPSTGETSSASGGATTASLDPCSLLSATDLASYGTFGDPRKREGSGARSCGYLRKAQDASDSHLGVDVNIRDSQGIDSVNDGGKGTIPSQVNARQAVLVPTGETNCVVAMAVGSTSRVDITVTSAADSTKACDTASQVAKIVEPKLPKG